MIAKTLTFPSTTGSWLEIVKRSQRFTKPKILEPQFLLVRLVPKSTVVVTVDGEVKYDWISACNVSGTVRRKTQSFKYCESGQNLSPHTHIFPGSLKANDANQVKRVYKASADQLLAAGYSHINVWLAPNNGPVSVVTERFPPGQRNKAIVLPSILQGVTMGLSFVPILRIPVSEESTFYNLSMVGINQVWHTYTLRIVTTSCYPTASVDATGVVQFHVPWAKEDVYAKVKAAKDSVTEMVLALNTPKPDPNDDRHPVVNLLLDPDCGYKVEIRFNSLISGSQLVSSQLIRLVYPMFGHEYK